MITLSNEAAALISGLFVGFISFTLWQILPKITPALALGLGAGIILALLT